MIISCSRRTDIPAFYSDWLMERIKAGYCMVPNPFNPNQVSKVSLKPDDVTAFVFWTRYPEPLIKHLKMLDEMGYKYYFLITINNYPKNYEVNNPNINQVFSSINKLNNIIGPEKIVWRYDPIILNESLNYDFHVKNFNFLIEHLKNKVRKIITSIITPYKKVVKKMKDITFDLSCMNNEDVYDLLRDINSIAKTNLMTLEICSYKHSLASIDIDKAKCIDNNLLNDLYGLNLSYKKDKSQRKECGCTVSKDIGQYNSCSMNCIYCYANTSYERALGNYSRHTDMTETIY
ncbi:MAG: hypothetical protein A2X61_05625 [Ignavibacteria bacterium GWB2_35_12]|nr:MAG: hypothetical protein A2X63_03870 [Ignavibacteria bacterium GWA2_35_8]OGU42235.1 MAG: hypothetical protein A2X61_05625 [Ignavibacteria bacterium GWB2_35_12]OGV20070.1 MAG: hypothetical protein A2475_04630 [Ignavibacteria bacterium RIFOXYC2_FULL_35_21]